MDFYVWIEVYLLGVGWIGMDLMFGLLVGEGYILFVCILQLMSVVLISGVIDECELILEYEMIVIRIYEDFCVICFYMDDIWM